MKFGKAVLGDYHQGTSREYLLTNGRGSYCCGSINGNNARQYHGLLIHSFSPPLDRFLTLHKIEETVNGISFAARRQIFAGKEKRSSGFAYLDSFEAAPFPCWIYSAGGTFLKKEICMPYQRDMILIKYSVIAGAPGKADFKADLFFNYRNTEEVTTFLNEEMVRDQYNIYNDNSKIKVSFDHNKSDFFLYICGSTKSLTLSAVDTAALPGKDFYGNEVDPVVCKNIAYDIDLNDRGETRLDSSYRFAEIHGELSVGDEFYVVGSMEEINNTLDPAALYKSELERVRVLKKAASKSDPFIQDLAYAADTFIVSRQSTGEKTVIAGYPWFGDWGRDTMIALPGLTLATGRFDDARSILKTFAHYCSRGMLPNKFPDYEGQELMYNTIDASLWYFYGVSRFLEYTGDYNFIKEFIFPTLLEILDFHIKGTRFGIKAAEDGLLSGGDKDTQLTWMDVKYQGWAVTPRYGKAVEINALWYFALQTGAALAKKFTGKDGIYETYAAKVKKSFGQVFWNSEGGCLYDYVTEEEHNSDIRPNQIFAVSLTPDLLDDTKNKKVVDTVMKYLYTPQGLRSLSADNSRFRGTYLGSLYERDSVYHQGTVWSHLMGHFITACRRVYGKSTPVSLLLDGLKNHFYEAGCINNVSEIFDGNAPHKARGCFAQAWAVGELLRVLDEEKLM